MAKVYVCPHLSRETSVRVAIMNRYAAGRNAVLYGDTGNRDWHAVPALFCHSSRLDKHPEHFAHLDVVVHSMSVGPYTRLLRHYPNVSEIFFARTEWEECPDQFWRFACTAQCKGMSDKHHLVGTCGHEYVELARTRTVLPINQHQVEWSAARQDE